MIRPAGLSFVRCSLQARSRRFLLEQATEEGEGGRAQGGRREFFDRGRGNVPR